MLCKSKWKTIKKKMTNIISYLHRWSFLWEVPFLQNSEPYRNETNCKIMSNFKYHCWVNSRLGIFWLKTEIVNKVLDVVSGFQIKIFNSNHLLVQMNMYFQINLRENFTTELHYPVVWLAFIATFSHLWKNAQHNFTVNLKTNLKKYIYILYKEMKIFIYLDLNTWLSTFLNWNLFVLLTIANVYVWCTTVVYYWVILPTTIQHNQKYSRHLNLKVPREKLHSPEPV